QAGRDRTVGRREAARLLSQCEVAAAQLSGEPRHQGLNVGDEFAQLNHAVAIAVAVNEGIEHSVGEHAVALIAFQSSLIGGSRGDYRPADRFVQSTDYSVRGCEIKTACSATD